MGRNPVNDKPHWLQDRGSNAIWHLKDRKAWVIGFQEDLGGLRAFMGSDDEVAGPQEATNWNYYNEPKKWITTSDDILVDSFDKPGAYLHNIYIPSMLLS